MNTCCQGIVSITGVRCKNKTTQDFCGQHRKHYALTVNKTVYRKMITKLILLKRMLIPDIYTVILPMFVYLFDIRVKAYPSRFEKVYYITFGHGQNKFLVRPL